MTKRTLAAGLMAALIAVLAPVLSAPAGAAGMTTHAWMAESAIDLVDDPRLEALLRANLDQVRAGARFPDGGYGPGNVYGEEAHWQRFFDVHADMIRGKADCGDLTAPTGPCAAQIAHLLGAVGHGTGDEVWDWLFEPNSPDLGEYYTHPDFAGFDDPGGQELVMDLVAIGAHQRPGGDPPPLPFPEEIITSLETAGLQGTTLEQLQNGQTFIGLVYRAETIWAEAHAEAVQAAMPWMSANLVDGPGGVRYAAQAIAGQWEAMWGRITGEQPATEVSVTYPADGQTGIPTGWVRESYQPGSHPGRGGARTRIAASITHALPYRAPGGAPVSTVLPDGAMTLTERDTGTVVPPMNGFPRVVPYGPDAGTHTVGFQPAPDLQPCTWYRVDITTALLDARGEPVVPHSWEFRTGQDTEGTECVDPVDPIDDYVERAYRDLLGRGADTDGLAHWTAALRSGMTTDRFAASLIGSVEHRRHTVRSLYHHDLGRGADADGLAYWSDQLRGTTVHAVRARLLASAEAYARAGGQPGPWVDHLYEVLLGRSPSTGDRDFWAGRLAAGASRGTVARQVAAAPEAHRWAARQVHTALLAAPPTAERLADATALVAGADVRALARRIVGQPPYAPS